MWQKEIETKSASQYFKPGVIYFQNLLFQGSGSWSVHLIMQFKYRIKLILACEKNYTPNFPKFIMLYLQQKR